MSDSGSTEAERGAQRSFRIGAAFGVLLLLAAVGLFDHWLHFVPNRQELGPGVATLRFRPIDLNAAGFAPFRFVGAWEVRSTDSRVGGISALAMDRGDLVALSDNGVVVRFKPPDGIHNIARLQELPDGPGDGRFKRNRDSEALTRDATGRGWWVAFENRHELWLYDDDFGRALDRIELGRNRWHANKGIEGVAALDDALLLAPEDGRSILRVTGSNARAIRLDKPDGRISDAAVVAAGELALVERRLTPFGFANSLLFLRKDGEGYRSMTRIPLPLRPIDNVEAVAFDRRSGRLWLTTDDNYQRPLRTLLIALELPASSSLRRAAEIRSTVSSRADN